MGIRDFPGSPAIKTPSSQCGGRGHMGLIPDWGAKSPQTARHGQKEKCESKWCMTGNPLQCSCLENPRDGGAWWAAVYGVAQSRTWLKWLSSGICLVKSSKYSDSLAKPFKIQKILCRRGELLANYSFTSFKDNVTRTTSVSHLLYKFFLKCTKISGF